MAVTAPLLAELVRRPSVNPMGRTDIPSTLTLEHRVTDYLAGELQALGVAYRREPVAPGRDNLIAEFRTGSKTTLLWEAHQDTVPTDGMIIEPFAATVRDGKLFGRGACDVKAGIACMFTAFARLVREAPAGAANVVLAFSVDEEHTFLGVQQLAERLNHIDLAVVAEPTGLNVVTAHKGVARWTITTTGRACHSSRPTDGDNAIYRMAPVLAVIEEYATRLSAEVRHPHLGPATMSVGMIRGGVSSNTVPDTCILDVDRRLLPGEDAAGAVADLDRVFVEKLPRPPRSELSFACPPLSPVAVDHPSLLRLEEAITRVHRRPERHAVPYGTDASSLSAAGIPSVVFGPGSIAQAHTVDEWIELRQVDLAADILFRFAAGPW